MEYVPGILLAGVIGLLAIACAVMHLADVIKKAHQPRPPLRIYPDGEEWRTR